MTFTQQLLTIGVVILGTMLTRFLPFLLFPPHKPTPPLVHDLGRLLPGAVFALLVVYCLKNVSLTAGSHGIPEAIAIAVVWHCTCGSARPCSPSPGAPWSICSWCRGCFESSPIRPREAHMPCVLIVNGHALGHLGHGYGKLTVKLHWLSRLGRYLYTT